MKMPVSIALLSQLTFSSCGAQSDHRVSQELGNELSERSKGGLALARFSESNHTLDLHFFDGRNEKLPLEISGDLKVLATGRIAVIDMDSTLRQRILNAAQNGNGALLMEEFERFGGDVVLISNSGRVERRSALSVNASVLAVSRDAKQFAFVGVPRGLSESEIGIYIADFESVHSRRLLAFGTDDPRKQHGARTRAELDWSPQGTSLLFSYRGAITELDVASGLARKIAAGGSARWSPSGDQISFVGPKLEATLLQVSTGKTMAIDPGFEIPSAIEWSPDGRYLLIPEGEGSHVPYGCHWVYRLSDGAFYPVCDFHMINPLPNWIEVPSTSEKRP